jgi:hypothetical protein
MKMSKKEKRKFTIELLNGSKVYANKWKLEFQASIAAIVSKMIVKAQDVIYERKDGEKTQHSEIFIPIFSIIAIYETD